MCSAHTVHRDLRPWGVSMYPVTPTTTMGGVSRMVTASTISFLLISRKLIINMSKKKNQTLLKRNRNLVNKFVQGMAVPPVHRPMDCRRKMEYDRLTPAQKGGEFNIRHGMLITALRAALQTLRTSIWVAPNTRNHMSIAY